MWVAPNCKLQGFSDRLLWDQEAVNYILVLIAEAIQDGKVKWVGGSVGATQWRRNKFIWMGNVYEAHQEGQKIVTISKLYPVPDCDTEDSDEALMIEAMAAIEGLNVVCVDNLPSGWGQF